MSFNAGELVASIRIDGMDTYLQSISKADSSTKAAQKTLDATAKSLDKQSTSTKGAAGAQSDLDAKTKQTTQSTSKQATSADDLSKKLDAQKQILDTAGKAAVAYGALVGAGLAVAVKAYADWASQMAQVQSLSHANAADMQALSAATMQFATQYGISATQAAEAQVELVKGGVSVKDMINGGLKGALTLAAAGQLDVGDATSIAVSAMTQFHLKGQDVSHIADLLAAGADKALGSVGDLGAGLKYVGPVASSAGVSLEQTVGVLAELAQNGVLGEQAGTSLRGMLSSLTSPSKLASDVMQQYGINVYDTTGKFIGFNGVAEQLKTKLGTLDQATRNQALGQIFGNQQITAATILMQGGAKSVDQWTDSVNESGFASEQASGKLNSLSGDATKLKAAFQNDLIQAGQSADGVLRSLAQGATSLLEGWAALPTPLKDTAFAFAAVTAGIGLLGGAALIAVPKIVAFDAALEAMGAKPKLVQTAMKSLGTFMTGPWGIAIAGAAAATFGLAKAMDAGKTSAEDYQNAITTGAKASDLLKKATDGFWNDSRWGGQKAVIQQFDDLDNVLDQGAKASHNFFYMLAENGDAYAAQKAIKELGKQIGAVAQTNLPAAQQAFSALADKTDGSQKSLQRLLDNMPDFKTALTEQATTLGISATKSHLLQLAMGDLGTESDNASSSAEDASGSIDDVQQSADDAAQAVSDLVKALENLDNGQIDASEAAVAMQQAISDATQAAKDNGATLDINTQKGRDNKKALDDIASSALSLLGAQEQAGASTDELSASTQSARDSFIAVAEKMGMSAQQAQDLADKYGLIPKDVETIVGANTAPAEATLDQLMADIKKRNANVTIGLTGPGAKYVYGAGVPQAKGSVLDFFADGGFGRPMTRREHHVAQIAPAGAWRVWAEPETGGEAYIPLAPSKRARSLDIFAETGKRLGVQGFAGGGFSVAQIRTPPLPSISVPGGVSAQASGAAGTPGLGRSLRGLAIQGQLDLGNGLTGIIRGVVTEALDEQGNVFDGGSAGGI